MPRTHPKSVIERETFGSRATVATQHMRRTGGGFEYEGAPFALRDGFECAAHGLTGTVEEDGTIAWSNGLVSGVWRRWCEMVAETKGQREQVAKAVAVQLEE